MKVHAIFCVILSNLVNKAQFPWLQFESIEYTDSNYENTYPISYTAGINFIFRE
ncbi:hypothetical protein LVD13_09410 [Flavobacteriaceae bacterium D16]|nr:hypothetical protein [Flavobacteriaceae bacterium D16]